MKTYIIHLTETDGDVVIQEVQPDGKEIVKYVEEHKLCTEDYAIIYGEVFKNFNGKRLTKKQIKLLNSLMYMSII